MKSIIPALLPLLFAGPAAAAENNFPTLARVDHVLTCMKSHGGQTLDNLYSCSCEIDQIAAQLSFKEFEEASTFSTMRKMPGERGGIYRASEVGEKLVARLNDAKAAAEKNCFLGPRTVTSKSAAAAGGPKP